MTQPEVALVVDDEEQLLRLTRRVLEREGYRVLTASSGAEARQIFYGAGAHVGAGETSVESPAEAEAEAESSAPGQIDLAVLDVQMPDGEGAATLMPELRAEHPGLRVILMSGDALPDALADALAASGGHFLRKPFVPKALIRIARGENADENPKTAASQDVPAFADGSGGA